jgi:N6-L-threonylcarbamoyladenine synthase
VGVCVSVWIGRDSERRLWGGCEGDKEKVNLQIKNSRRKGCFFIINYYQSYLLDKPCFYQYSLLKLTHLKPSLSMKILAIDTSCDETSVAITEDDRVISNKVSSQIEFHKKYGGVMPTLARRLHEEQIDFVVQEAIKGARTTLEKIDVFAVTYGPGLAIALEVGLAKAKELALTYHKPLIGVNHMEGHLYSALAHNAKGNPKIEYAFPLLALLVSGGHTEIVLMQGHGVYDKLGQTLDDAVGEAFDKVARMLELGYPGGPMIEELAERGDAARFPLPIPMSKEKTLNMSYSGLKTAVLYLTKKVFTENMEPKVKSQMICDIAASFQKSAFDSIILKTKRALEQISTEAPVRDIVLGGGVSANGMLRKRLRKEFGKKYRLHYPTNKKLYGDNAGMIGVAAYHNAVRGKFVEDVEKLDRDPNLSL